MMKKGIDVCADIVVSRWIALKGTLDLCSEYKERLSLELPSFILKNVRAFEDILQDRREPAIAGNNAFYVRELGKSGIYGALWELGEDLKTGLFADLKEIPVKQETIEIANILDKDPYKMDSEGAFLFLSESGYALKKLLLSEGINAAVIGSTTQDNDRVIYYGDKKRFLTPPDSVILRSDSDEESL